MPRSRSRIFSRAAAFLWAACTLACWTHAHPALAGEGPPPLSIGAGSSVASESPRHPFRQAGQTARRASGTAAASSGGWWIGTAGIALILAVFGGMSLASRRFLPARGQGPLEVVGRTSLSPKHTVYLLRAGEQILIVGTGPQGSPALLGEWIGPSPVDRARTSSRTPFPPPAAPGAIDEGARS